MHKYIVQAWHILLKFRIAATTCFTGVGLHKSSCVSTHYKRHYVTQMAQIRSALSSVLAPGASNRDNTIVKPR